MSEISTLCVYCGAARGRNVKLEEFASGFGAACASRGIKLVFGGGGLGLMGAVSDGARKNGGRVIGIIPRSLEEIEIPPADLSDLVVVDNMHERKQQMFQRADGFVSLPGGFGTLEETIEIITWRQLGFHDKPVILANHLGYWDPLISLFEHIVASGFAHADSRDLYRVADSVDEIFEGMNIAPASND